MFTMLVRQHAKKTAFYNVKWKLVTRNMTFTGNTAGVPSANEQRLTRGASEDVMKRNTTVEGGHSPMDSRMIAGIAVPSRPFQPENCCMSGCVNCVWDIYSEDIKYWRLKRLEAVEKVTATSEVWPEDWDPPLKLLPMKNIPKSLKSKKLEYEELVKNASIDKVNGLFPPRKHSLPKSVIEAKKRNLIKKTQENLKAEEVDNDGWNDIPVSIKAFAEFERKKKLSKVH
ncbi:hypothetical protein TPHA_0A01190 [Tetrapisispora phaffii CBS 4417]|uniref:Oxidoreductase-like domain-containing protein n=1 Tax=Tetrapisispora phaffii (strain ATCC 24235 / CBS 4417 / NBRC 1672 / NRRL Y-8282 / UCD 70-5) TaxID=1071381 RepID=G8BMS5_TETPH|nr:hypothetical protein TPHA_0A01190 [Tetrapisispora phaffii CBS 4417]CCE61203.1 hypothetical protein TPHA_0A01190 [Tetrapisispora phaffii CBS 4417]